MPALFQSICVLLLASVACLDLPAQSGSVVTIDSNKVMILNGRNVFPITFSPGPPTYSKTPAGDDALKELRDAGALIYRMAQTTDWNSQVISNQHAALDWAQQQRMYCMVNLREVSEFAAGDATTEAALRSLVNRFKNHPALAVWKNADEAWWAGVSAADLQRGYEVIKQEDPNHPIEQTHAPRGTVAQLQPYNAAADILAIDIYPVSIPPGTHSLLPNKEISMVGDWTQFLAQVANGQKQYWMVEQIAWSGATPPNRPLIFPTFRQSRFMAYQAIINGARGLMFFGGNVAATLNLRDAPFGWNWTFWEEVLRPVVEEIGDHSVLAQALVATESILPITISGASFPDVEFCVREAPPYLYLLACKREGVAANVTFTGLPTWAGIGEVLYESPRTVIAHNGQFSDTFAPFDVHVYRFAQSNQSPVVVFQPQSRTNHPGTETTFGVVVDGTGPLTFQWRKNGQNVSDATSSELTFANVSHADAGNYDVVVAGSGSVISQVASLNVVDFQTNQIPAITYQPQSQTACAGGMATFEVGVSGDGPFAYQWRKNGAALPGATSWKLTLTNVSAADEAGYDVIVAGFTAVTSGPPAAFTLMVQTNQLLLYEAFDYLNIGGPVSSNNPSLWTFGGSAPNDLSVVAGNLNYPGLAPSRGNSVTNGGAGFGVRRLVGSGVSNGALYFSALFRINHLGYGVWNGAASQVGALTANDNVSFRLAVMVRSNSPSGYVFGVQKGGSGASTLFDTREHRVGETVFLVGKYDFNAQPDRVTLWINPDPSRFGSPCEAATDFLPASTGTDGLIIDRFNMRQNTAPSVPAAMQWDELRIGRTWADVTPAPLTILFAFRRLENGMFQFSYSDESGRNYAVFASTNLADWTELGMANQVSPGLYEFTDPEAANYTQRFYRLDLP